MVTMTNSNHNTGKNGAAAAAVAAAVEANTLAAGNATFAWEKRIRRLVDDSTFVEYQHIDHVPRIEDHAHENLEIVVAIPDAFVPASTNKPWLSTMSTSTISTSTSTSLLMSPTKSSSSPGQAGGTTMSIHGGSSHSRSSTPSTPKSRRRNLHGKAKMGDPIDSSDHLSPRRSSKKKTMTDKMNGSSDHSSSRRKSKKTVDKDANVDSSDHSPSPRRSKKIISSPLSPGNTRKKVPKKSSSSAGSSEKDYSQNSSNSSLLKSPTTKKSSHSSSSLKKKGLGDDLLSSTRSRTTTSSSSSPTKTPKAHVVQQGDLDIPSLFTAAFPPLTNSPRSRNSNNLMSPSKKNAPKTSRTLSDRNKKPSSGGLGAFLHQNAVEKFKEKLIKGVSDDVVSIGNRSISSRSVSELSHAERSRAEDALPRKSWWKSRSSPSATSPDNIRNQMIAVRGDSSGNVDSTSEYDASFRSRSRSARSSNMQAIDEMSTNDFSEVAPSPHESPVTRKKSSTASPLGRRSPNKNSPIGKGGDLGTFLQQKYFTGGRDDDDEDDDGNMDAADNDMQSVATFGNLSISEMSNAEQSGSEQRLRRDRTKKRQDNGSLDAKYVAGKLSAAAADAVTVGESDNSLEQNKETEKPTPTCPPASMLSQSCLRSSRYGSSSSSATDDSNNDSIRLADIEVSPVEEKQLKFRDGHSEREIPDLTDSLYDILFYTEEELADFRYQAFLEECGLDVNEFM